MATQFDFLLSQVRTSTTSLAGGLVYFYVPGTTTPARVWLDREETIPASNPLTLDSNGTALVFGNGLYRVVIKDAAGVTRFDRDGIPTADPSGAAADVDSRAVHKTGNEVIHGKKTFPDDIEAPIITALNDAMVRKSGNETIYGHKTFPDDIAAPALNALDTRITAVQAAQSSGSVGYATQALLFADLAHGAGTVGYVNADSDTAKNGFYLKAGASGAGSWVQSPFDRVTMLQTGPIADISDKIGGSRIRSDKTYGNALITGSSTPTGAVWADFTAFSYGGQLTKLEAYIQAAGDGTGKFLILAPSGSNWVVKSVIPVTGVSTGLQTFTAEVNFTAVSVEAGSVIAWHAAAGGAAVAYTAGAGSSLQATTATVAQGDTLTMTAGSILFSLRATVSTMPAIVDSRLGALENNTSALRSAVQRNLKSAVTSGVTSPDVVDGTFASIYCSEPTLGDGYLSDFRARFSRAGSGEVHILQPAPNGDYKNVGVYPVSVSTGEGSLVSQLPSPLWVTKGTRFAYKPITGVAPRRANGGPTYTAVGDTGYGASVTLNYENVTTALSLSVAPVARASAVIEAQRFTGTASAAWTLNGWTWGPSGLTGPDTPGWTKSAYLNRFTASSKRGLRARFTVSDPASVFGLSYDPSTNVSYGSAAIVDGTNGQLRIYLLNGVGVVTLSKQVAIPWTIPSSVELQWDRSDMSQTVTLYNPLTQEQVSVSQTLGDAGTISSASINYGRPGVIHVSGTAGSVVCTSFELSRRAPRKLHAIVFGDSIAQGNANGAAWASNWPYALDAARGKGDVLNCSLGGGTTGELTTRLGLALGSVPGDIDLATYEPAYVVLALGVNDGDQTLWRANMTSLINAILAKGAVPILSTVTPFAAKQTLLDAMNADIISGYFGAYDFIDFAAAVTVNGDRVTPDTSLYLSTEGPSNYLHPNAAGQARMFQQVQIDAPWLVKDPAE